MARLDLAAMLVICLALLAGSAGASGTIDGYARDKFGVGIYELRVYLQRDGGGDCAVGLTQPDGRYTCSGLADGTWTAYCSPAGYLRARVRPGIVVAGGAANGDITFDADYQVQDINGSGDYDSFGQTFMPLGSDIVEVGVYNDWDADRVYSIAIYDEPGGTQIGPSGVTPTIGKGGKASAVWVNGEVPVVPGHIYYVEATRQGSGDVGPVVAGGNPYPYGSSYFNGSPNTWVDIQFFICSDNDGTVITYDYPDSNSGWTLGTWCGEVGQTFTATGTSLAGFDTYPTIGWNQNMSADVSVHAGGPWGAQIGPTKSCGFTADWGHGWAFAPGEVPLTPGQTYYIKMVRTPPDSGLNYQYVAYDIYPGGIMYRDGVANSGYDLVGRVMEYNDLPEFTIDDIQFTNPADDHVEVTWHTSVGSTSQAEYWEVGSTDPHTHTAVETNQWWSHSRTLTGLEPGHTYNVIVKSFRSGYEWMCSPVQVCAFTLPGSGTVSGYVRDDLGAPIEGALVTMQPCGYDASTDDTGYYENSSVPAGACDVTAARVGYQDVTVGDRTVYVGSTTTVDFELEPWPNLMENPGFETGAVTPWTSFDSGMGIESGLWSGGITAHSGNYFAGKAMNGATGSGGMYQRVTCRFGAEYDSRLFCRVYHGDNNWDSVRVRVGIDRYGGTWYLASTIQWSEWLYPPARWESEYVEMTPPRVTASGNHVTLFLQYEFTYTNSWHIVAADGGGVFGPTPYVSSTSPSGWLSAGWNLMSFPLQPVAQTVTAALDSVIAAGNDLTNSMYSYDGTYAIYPGDFNTVSRGKAYWLLLTVGAQESILGDEAYGEADVPLLDGWSFIGHPQGNAVLLADCSITDGATTLGFADAVAAGWVDPVAYYYDGSYLMVRADGSGDDDSLRPWYGYWFLANVAGLELVVP